MIGVFDSGIGGLSILQALRREMPGEDFIYLADSAHAPYGERDEAHLITRSRAIAGELIARGADLLVVACNTATAAAVARLRRDHPALPIVGVEPALKPAVAASATRHIGVMATRSTLASARFQALLAAQSGQARFTLQPCDGLADAIERGLPHIAQLCAQHLGAMGRFGAADGEIDTLVLGCTHYPLVEATIAAITGPDVRLLSTGEAVARQTRRLLPAPPTTLDGLDGLNASDSLDALAALNASNARSDAGHAGRLTLLGTGDLPLLDAAARRWLGVADQPQAVDC